MGWIDIGTFRDNYFCLLQRLSFSKPTDAAQSFNALLPNKVFPCPKNNSSKDGILLTGFKVLLVYCEEKVSAALLKYLRLINHYDKPQDN